MKTKRRPPRRSGTTHRAICLLLLLFHTAPAPTHGQARAQKKEDLDRGRAILQQAILSAGGQDAFNRIRSFTIKTESEIVQAESRLQLTVTETVLLPDKTRQVMELAAGTRIQVLNRESGWKRIGKKVSDLSNIEKREMQRGLFRDVINLFKSWQNADFTVSYFGTEILAGKTAYVLHIRNRSGDFFNLYVNAETYLIDKKAYQGAAEAGLATFEEIYSDYREVDGIKLPFKTVIRTNGRKFMESKVLQARLNVDVDDSFFEIVDR